MKIDEDVASWFGPDRPVGELPIDILIRRLREFGDAELSSELAASDSQRTGTYGGLRMPSILRRFVRTVHVCGYLPLAGKGGLVPVSRVKGDRGLSARSLKISLAGLHIGRYPGVGRHSILFDFAMQGQSGGTSARVLHYNAKFDASNGETVAVRNLPLFYDFVPSDAGLMLGFQTVNVASSFNDGLLDFLGGEEFKKGMSLLASSLPLVGQISEMGAGITRWLAGQSKNLKVQEFRQGLDLAESQLGGGLAQGYYVVVQIPADRQSDWSWDNWKIDRNYPRLTAKDADGSALDFNHVIFGVQAMDS